MVEKFRILQVWSSSCPDELHDEASCHEEAADYPEWDADLGDGQTRAGTTWTKSHVHHSISNEEAGDRVPSPRIHPPGCEYECDGTHEPPAWACIWDDDHSHVDGVALLEDCRDDPQHLRGKCETRRLGLEVVRDPKGHEDGVEVGEGAWKYIDVGIERFIAGHVCKIEEISRHRLREDKVHHYHGGGDGKPESNTTAEDSTGEDSFAGVEQERQADGSR